MSTLVIGFFGLVAISQQSVTLLVVAIGLIGGLGGFLKVNRYPAQVFMGDLGSLALGGAVAGFAFATGTALLIPIVGGIYFAETLSVIIQVVSFKTTGKRVLKCHHYTTTTSCLGGKKQKLSVRFTWLHSAWLL